MTPGAEKVAIIGGVLLAAVVGGVIIYQTTQGGLSSAQQADATSLGLTPQEYTSTLSSLGLSTTSILSASSLSNEPSSPSTPSTSGIGRIGLSTRARVLNGRRYG